MVEGLFEVESVRESGFSLSSIPEEAPSDITYGAKTEFVSCRA